jgi:excisionase family DNA binding protein
MSDGTRHRPSRRRPVTTSGLLPLPLLEVFQVARRLNVSPESVRRLLRARKLSAIRLGTRCWRVDPVDLQAFVDAQRVERATDDAEAIERRLQSQARAEKNKRRGRSRR